MLSQYIYIYITPNVTLLYKKKKAHVNEVDIG